eukprot:Blabericola_migrator_1__1235@NODE_1317_length_4827_cov_19_255252_g887_i0_p2_GENE_NODE_1317_length_4827_cov_19_255252_g887_i0NODE_1317_length_4827_cov_19_255252_g887_i0_p2_ORF_typecomplete_len316_score17_70PAP2/PF01569_21/2_2e26PAP2_3/PF14378_6/7_5e06ArAE_2_N/PF10337_9/0_0003MASE5/PF17178_4/3_1MASE5/PF17178_4/2_1Alpha_GJ/PF03229_13/6_3e03Alpha_GJ/PF03229_13/0_027DUF2339/PF10101_9/0_56DUF2339/PF10101_9/9_8DUF2157/PF09925_9/4_6DUF2157/PF09925_9/17Polysacc_synt_C/PF14667_6/0_29Polysacc_synt_C/PF1466
MSEQPDTEGEKPFYRGVFRPGWLGKEILIRLGLMGIAGLLLLIPPFQRRIPPEKWYKYRYPFTHKEMFPAVGAALILLLAPVFNLGIMLYLIRKKRTQRQLYRQGVLYVLGLWLATCFAILTCEVIKRLYGGLRPDFLSRCFGVDDSDTLLLISKRLTTDEPLQCEQSPYPAKIIWDGRMSFPSEHSATSFAIFTFVGLWNMERIKSIEGYGAQALVVPAICLAIPLIIAISRTSDYRHHTTDVLTGILIGGLCAVAVFYFYFPRRRRSPGTRDSVSLSGEGMGESAPTNENRRSSEHAYGLVPDEEARQLATQV